MSYPLLNESDLKALLGQDSTFLIDTRGPEAFASGFLKGSISCKEQSTYTALLSELVPEGSKIVVLIEADANPARIMKALNSCGIGAVEGFFQTADAPGFLGDQYLDMIITIEADELAMDLPHDENLVLIDVRTEAEYAEGHIIGAQHMELEKFADPAHVALIPELANVYLYCSNGLRSMTAASVFKWHGLHNVRVILQDWEFISQTEGLKIEKDQATLN